MSGLSLPAIRLSAPEVSAACLCAASSGFHLWPWHRATYARPLQPSAPLSQPIATRGAGFRD